MIHRQTVQRDALAYTYPHRAQFLLPDPHPSHPGHPAPGLNPKTTRAIDHEVLQALHVRPGSYFRVSKVDDWVEDELSGAVVGDVAAASGFVDLRAACP